MILGTFNNNGLQLVCQVFLFDPIFCPKHRTTPIQHAFCSPFVIYRCARLKIPQPQILQQLPVSASNSKQECNKETSNFEPSFHPMSNAVVKLFELRNMYTVLNRSFKLLTSGAPRLHIKN
jgi:hypothetical protein